MTRDGRSPGGRLATLHSALRASYHTNNITTSKGIISRRSLAHYIALYHGHLNFITFAYHNFPPVSVPVPVPVPEATMSIRVLLREHPNRAIALVTDTHALIFRHSPSSATETPITGSSMSLSSRPPQESNPRCVVEFAKLDTIDQRDYRDLNSSHRTVHGTLGLITIEKDVFICVITGASKVAQVRPGETVERIYSVEFYCLNSSKYDIPAIDALNNINPYEINSRAEEDYTYGQHLRDRDPLLEHPAAELSKMLSNGSFYYSTDFDLTNRMQDRYEHKCLSLRSQEPLADRLS